MTYKPEQIKWFRKRCLQRLRYYRDRFMAVELFSSDFRGMFSPFAQKKHIKIPFALDYNITGTYDALKKVIEQCNDEEIVQLHWKFECYIINKRRERRR